jgi:DNA (cytosine-5)-methyltransferase 1
VTSIGSFCTGFAALDHAVQDVYGGTLSWVADNDPGAAKILAHHYPDVPNLGDITALNWDDVPPVDIVAAGFPCQDISYAGRGAGIKEGNRSGLWHTIADAIRALRPRLVVLENVAAIVGRRPGLDVVLADLTQLGFDAEWTVVPASRVGAPHLRKRWFCLAWPAANPPNLGHQRGGNARGRRNGLADRGHPAADTHLDERARERGEQPRRVVVAGGRGSAADAHRGGQRAHEHHLHARQPDIEWGLYGPAIRRWETVLGRPAPRPAQPGRNGQPQLSPRFVEWMQGCPDGWVTDVPDLTRNQQLKALGNGVVAAQAAYALRLLDDRAGWQVAA